MRVNDIVSEQDAVMASLFLCSGSVLPSVCLSNCLSLSLFSLPSILFTPLPVPPLFHFHSRTILALYFFPTRSLPFLSRFPSLSSSYL